MQTKFIYMCIYIHTHSQAMYMVVKHGLRYTGRKMKIVRKRQVIVIYAHITKKNFFNTFFYGQGEVLVTSFV